MPNTVGRRLSKVSESQQFFGKIAIDVMSIMGLLMALLICEPRRLAPLGDDQLCRHIHRRILLTSVYIQSFYGVATVSRLLKMIGLFCK